MKPVEFKQVNVRISEKQEEYVTLPAYIEEAPTGTIVTCFELEDDEIEEIVKTRKLWHQQLAFHQPMQPILLTTKCPFPEDEELNENDEEIKSNMDNTGFIEYEYGAMSSRYKLKAKNKLTAYATIIFHYRNSPHLVVVFTPEECKRDNWANTSGHITERLDEIFGGAGSFDKYLEDNIDEIRECYQSIKQV